MWNRIFHLTIIFGFTYSSCPFQGTYPEAQKLYNYINAKNERLIAQGNVVGPTDPANLFFTTFPLPENVPQLFNLSTTLMLGEQLFTKPLKSLPQSAKLALLKSQDVCIPSYERCNDVAKEDVCNDNQPYRNVNGSCNNLLNPNWGISFSQYTRLKKAVYEDGINEIRRSVVNNTELPLVRDIGNFAMETTSFAERPPTVINFNGLTMGEYITHDVAFRLFYQEPNGGPGHRCCTADNQMLPKDELYYGCFPFEYRKDDPIASLTNRTCSYYIRTQPIFNNECTLSESELVNSVTHFMDNSNIYGSIDSVASSLRTFESGQMQIVNNILPQLPNCDDLVPQPPFNCYHIGGDPRGVIFPTMSLIHSVFLRLHNNIASELSKLNPQWNDEKLYQEARRLQIALYQHIMYKEYLGIYFDQQTLESSNLTCSNYNMFCGSYNASVNPGTLSEFAHGALTQFHVNLPYEVNFYNDSYQVTETVNINGLATGPKLLETRYNEALRALLMTPINFDKYSDELRNNLFNAGNPLGLGVDLLSDDITRGRDHGHSGYTVYKDMCTPDDPPVSSWDDLVGIISDEHLGQLRNVYASVFDLDLSVGLTLETRTTQYFGIVGQCLLIEQYKRYKFGDRFFYTFADSPNPFTQAQMKEIYKYTFAKHYCSNVDIAEMLPRPLEMPGLDNQFTNCSEFGTLDLSAWKEN